eukprot:gene17756-21179_t
MHYSYGSQKLTQLQVVSGSSDASIKVWNATSGECIKSVKRHDDYVKALAYSPGSSVFASSGLDSHIILWDLNVFQAKTTMQADADQVQCAEVVEPMDLEDMASPRRRKPEFSVAKAGGDHISTYSLAINQDSTVVLAGSTKRAIVAWDVREGKKLFKLKGHTDNVRAIAMSADSMHCVSASSDGSFRLWDMGTRRCIHAFDDVHSDSVWSVAANQTFSTLYSGGRDGLIYVTDLHSFRSRLLSKETSPVLKLLHDERANSLWSATTDATVRAWRTDLVAGDLCEPRFIDDDRGEDAFVASCPMGEISGRPGIIKHHILNNRRQILTKDTDDTVQLWDVTRGEQVKSLGKADFDRTIDDLQEVVSIPKWFSVDTKTGSIYITLESPLSFSADVNLSNIGFTIGEGEEDSLYNMGERIIASLFSNWVRERQIRLSAMPSNEEPMRVEPVVVVEDVTLTDSTKRIKSTKFGGGGSSSSSSTTPIGLTPNNSTNSIESISQVPRQEKRMLFELPRDTSIVISDENAGTTVLRGKLDEFPGMSWVDAAPRWLFDCLYRGTYQRREVQRLSIVLLPSEERNISVIAAESRRISASSVFQIRRILNHIGQNLKLFEANSLAEEYLEILCNGKIMQPNYTLATVKTFFWKSSDDLQLHYRVKSQYGNDSELKRMAKLNQIKKIIEMCLQNETERVELEISSSMGT